MFRDPLIFQQSMHTFASPVRVEIHGVEGTEQNNQRQGEPNEPSTYNNMHLGRRVRLEIEARCAAGTAGDTGVSAAEYEYRQLLLNFKCPSAKY